MVDIANPVRVTISHLNLGIDADLVLSAPFGILLDGGYVYPGSYLLGLAGNAGGI